jgi:hypothetical protein
MLSFAVRLPLLNRREFWLDESVTGLFAGSSSLSELRDLLAAESNPPLYYLLQYLWACLFGTDEVAMRLTGVILSAVSVWLVFRGVRLLGASLWSAASASLFLVLSPVWVYYSLEARSYMLFWTTGLALVVVLLKAVGNPDATLFGAPRQPGSEASPDKRLFPLRHYVLASVLTLLALYTNYFAVFLYWAWLWAFVRSPRCHRWKVALAAVFPAILFLPWVLSTFGAHASGGGTRWIHQFWSGPFDSLWQTFKVLVLVPPFPRYLGELGQLEGLGWPGVLAGALMGLPVLLGTMRKNGLMLLGLVAVGAGVPVLISLWRPVALPGRYELLVYPAWVMLWGLGTDGLFRAAERRQGSRWWPMAGTVLVAVVLVVLTIPYLRLPEGNRPYETIAGAVAEIDSDPLVVALGYTYAGTRHKLRALGRKRVLPFPSAMKDHPGWIHRPDHPPEELTENAAAVVRHVGDATTLWMVSTVADGGRPAFPWLDMPLYNSLVQRGFRPSAPMVVGDLVALRFQLNLDRR